MNDAATVPDAAAYHDGMRRLQDRFDTRRLADRLDEKLTRRQFSAEDRAFIGGCTMFFLATADAHGRPDCSYRGGAAGFVRVTDASELAFPSYDGDGKFRSLGNTLVNPAAALLFIDFEKTQRLRVLGTADMRFDDPLLAEFAGAKLVVRVRAAAIFPNCPRYLHRLKLVALSPYVPHAGVAAPVPAWKRNEMFRDVLPHDDPARQPEPPAAA
jgi:hypothetical protein